MHKFFELLSDALNEQGLEMKVVLKPTWEIWWTGESVKNNLYKPLLKAMFNKDSTSEMNWNEVSEVYDQLMHGLMQKFPELEYIEFPHDDWEEQMRKDGIIHYK